MAQIVLMYHDVYRENTAESGFQTIGSLNYKLRLDQFESQLIIIRTLIDRNPELNCDILFTFDDGGESAYSLVGPLLKKYGFRGWFFITTSMIGKAGFCSEDRIKELYEDGHIIGSHNHTHRSTTKGCTSESIIDEWKRSSEIIEKIIGVKPFCASLPNGFLDSKIGEAVKEAGFKRVFTSSPTTKVRKRDGIDFVGRYSISASMSPEYIKAIVTSSFTRKRIEVRACILNNIKALLGSSYSQIKTRLLKLVYGK